MKKTIWHSVFAFLFYFIVASAWAQNLDKIIEGAKKDGSVKLGITLRLEVAGKPSGTKVLDAFRARYPFVKVDFERVGGTREREKVLTELAGGRISYDVTTMTVTQVTMAKQANIVEMVDWRALGIQPQDVAPQGLGVNYQYGLFGIAYNRKLISDDAAKKLTWEDCASPKWKKKAAMNDTPVHLELFWQPGIWGREKTLAHAKQLAANETVFERSNEDIINKIVLGEYALSCGNVYQNYKEVVLAGKGDVVGFVAPEPVPATSRAILFLPKGGQHQNAAKLFIVWAVSDEGQKILDAVDFSGSPQLASTEAGKLAKGKKIVWYEPEYQLKAAEIRKEIVQAIGLPVVR